MTAAVLAVQGAFIEHEKCLRRLGIDCIEIREKADLRKPFDGLVLPGGESTVQSKLLRDLGLFAPLRQRIADGLPTMATCAGLILLAEEVHPNEPVCFGTLPVCVRRNAYGRQLGSFYTERKIKGIGTFPMTFIRAPYIERVGEGTEVLSVVDGRITAVRCQNQLAMSFHPELSDDLRIHEAFLDMMAGKKQGREEKERNEK